MARRPPVMTLFPASPSSSASSVATYDSELSSRDSSVSRSPGSQSSSDAPDDDEVPAALPPPRFPRIGTGASPAAADPGSFARLFPSLDRLAVRHDDAVAHGNMSLRVEVAAGPATVQLFHLRMRDLARRDFSLRRYGRDSRREVCACRGAYEAAPTGISRSVSAALRSVATPFRPSGALASSSSLSSWSRRRWTAASSPAAAVVSPTDTVRLEFANYARVDVRRRARRTRRYEFEWWGRRYAWRRVVDPALGTVSFHLVRDGQAQPVAHIVPETRTPAQVAAEARAGGWVPPCHMWISDRSLVEAVTDVADVAVATGLVALVDDCIRKRWPAEKSAPLFPARPHIGPDDAAARRPRTGVRAFFSRKSSASYPSNHRHLGRTVAVC